MFVVHQKVQPFAIYGVKSVAISVLIWEAKMIQFVDKGQCIVCRMCVIVCMSTIFLCQYELQN
jgi:hypothetical protein